VRGCDPGGGPIEVSNELDSLFFTLTLSLVPAKSVLTSLSLQSLEPAGSRTSNMRFRLMVSKAGDISMPIV